VGAGRGAGDSTHVSPGTPPSGACWSFSFGEWAPPLDWSGAGHRGDTASANARVRRARDSVFVHDSAAVESNAMEWDRTEHGWELMLFPSWWPAGVVVRFDGNPADSAVTHGEATAMLGDPNREPSRTRVMAKPHVCGR
jgi:hypothetical protein